MQNLSEVTSVILAGGLGTRLRSVVSDRPKVLARVGNRPFLTFLLDQLIAARAKEVILCTGFMADEVHKDLGHKYKSLNIVYSPEPEPLGTGGALRLALPLINSDPVLIMNGDSFAEVNLTDYIEWFCQRDRQASLLLVKVADTGRYGKVIVDDDGRITAFEEKTPDDGPGWINGGIYIMRKSLVESIPAATPYSLERQLFPALAKKNIYGFCSNGKFIDIGTPDSYCRVQEFFAMEAV
ncbi:MAG: nucleotidyltransferase family protein [Desulfobacterales bacterium]|nr:MAG: nucleotidyltransferase family protein [Desulfobacterales bacterium]